ncbi:MAG: response regulator transcription factor [Eubacteriales bacterium]
MSNILVVEDDEAISMAVEYSLQRENFNVFVAATCNNALELLKDRKIDLALLDINLPDGNGYSLCERIKTMYKIPIIFLTVYDEEANIVMGLDMGADDYLTKPFRIKELVARINAVLRRDKKNNRNQEQFYYKYLRMDALEGKVYDDGKEISLTSIEYRLLLTLFINKGITLTREQILNKIWDVDGEFINDNTLTVSMKRLREKIEKDPRRPQIIHTVRGLGYRLGE